MNNLKNFTETYLFVKDFYKNSDGSRDPIIDYNLKKEEHSKINPSFDISEWIANHIDLLSGNNG